VDSAFSLEPEELRALVVETERAWRGLGRVTYGPTDGEKKSLVFRRSLYIARDMRAGDVLTPENLRVVRPGNGLHPRYYEMLLGKRVARDLKKGEAVDWDIVGQSQSPK
jgi:N-acetylneuraminate synthase